MAALMRHGVRQTLVHAGDVTYKAPESMRGELGLPDPDVTLDITCGTAADRTAQLVVPMETCLLDRKPDLVLVYGDTEVTVGTALTAAKLGFDLGHVDAGLRSDDRWTPESVNRAVTDRLSSWLFTQSHEAGENLLAERKNPAAIKLVGNVLVDTLVRLLPRTQPEPLMYLLGLMNGKGPVPFALATVHESSTIDDQDVLDRLLDGLTDLTRDLPVVFPLHPGTRRRMKDLRFSGLLVTEPMTYLQFLGLQQHATVVITDSGAVQEETTYLGVPCLAVRETTERSATTTFGTSVLVGRDTDALKRAAHDVLAGEGTRGSIPPLWDGHAAERVATHLLGERRACA
jgi:UDP-N-acetylglucosamine 2-epimerase (non-hydrolysing)